MKLYDVPNNTRVRVVSFEEPPLGGRESSIGQEINFKHIDGMYSYCVDDRGCVVHLKAWTEVEIVEGTP